MKEPDPSDKARLLRRSVFGNRTTPSIYQEGGTCASFSAGHSQYIFNVFNQGRDMAESRRILIAEQRFNAVHLGNGGLMPAAVMATDQRRNSSGDEQEERGRAQRDKERGKEERKTRPAIDHCAGVMMGSGHTGGIVLLLERLDGQCREASHIIVHRVHHWFTI